MAKRTTFTRMLVDLLSFMVASGDNPIIDYVKRSNEEQKRLFALGLSKCDGVNNKSKHQEGKAVDIYLADKEGTILLDWKEGDKTKFYHDYWETIGGAPMLDWDVGHFETR